VILPLALIAVFGLGVTFVLLRARAAAKVDWKVLPRGTRYQVPPGFEVARLERALARVVDLLSAIWPRPEVERVVNGAEVVVMRDTHWVDGYGRSIGGDSFGSHIRVGSDMGALLHEAAHACQTNVDHVVDQVHASWNARGISAADVAYRAWAKGQ
jgi:hypothetical protein